MNRRDLFALGSAGVAGLLFPQKSEGESDRPVLEGLTDLEMGELIDQPKRGAMTHSRDHSLFVCSKPRTDINGIYSSWWVLGTVVHKLREGERTTVQINITSLKNIYIVSPGEPDFHYHRIVGKNGVGWFLVGK